MSRLISSESSANYQTWQLPLVEDVSAAVALAKNDKAPGLLTAEKIEAIQKQAYKEAYDAGFAKGRQDGVATGTKQVNEKIQLLQKLLQSLSTPLHELDQAVEQELVGLAVAIARQLVRRELRADPGEVVGVVHEALAALPIGSRQIRVCLHPEDARLVSSALAKTEADRNWSLADDPSLARGDCVILTDVSRVDAGLERRLASVVAQLAGDARKPDSASPAP
jgi:flagellar assembly protein FliH